MVKLASVGIVAGMMVATPRSTATLPSTLPVLRLGGTTAEQPPSTPGVGRTVCAWDTAHTSTSSLLGCVCTRRRRRIMRVWVWVGAGVGVGVRVTEHGEKVARRIRLIPPAGRAEEMGKAWGDTAMATEKETAEEGAAVVAALPIVIHFLGREWGWVSSRTLLVEKAAAGGVATAMAAPLVFHTWLATTMATTLDTTRATSPPPRRGVTVAQTTTGRRSWTSLSSAAAVATAAVARRGGRIDNTIIRIRIINIIINRQEEITTLAASLRPALCSTTLRSTFATPGPA